jgi:hypothetical protein
MKRISNMTTEQLVERFTAIALDQAKALQKYDITKVNRLFDQMEAVEAELKDREGDQRHALLHLYNHPIPHVRLKAALATLAVAREQARRLLQAIAISENGPQAADAKSTLRMLDSGEFKPT